MNDYNFGYFIFNLVIANNPILSLTVNIEYIEGNTKYNRKDTFLVYSNLIIIFSI